MSSFFLPITPLLLSFPPHCLWKWLHGFGFDPCLPFGPLSNFPKANIQSLMWKDGKYFAKGRRRMEGLFKERNFTTMRDIVWNGPKQNLGLGHCQKMFSSKTGTWTRVSQMVALARSWGSFPEDYFILAAFSFLHIISCFRLLFLSEVRDSPRMFCACPCRKRGAAQRQVSIVVLPKSIHRQSILSLNKWTISSPVYLPGLQQPRLLIGSSLFPQQNNSFSFMDCSPQIQSWQKWKSIFTPLDFFFSGRKPFPVEMSPTLKIFLNLQADCFLSWSWLI